MPRPSGQWIRHNTSGEDRFAAFDVGDVIKITGSNANNGIYTINSITNNDDYGTDYSYMGLTGPSITDDPADTGVVISDISSKGNRVVCLGDEDTGEVDVWSYSDATDEDGSFAVSPVVGTNGWSTTAIKPVLSGSNANFIFTQVDDTTNTCGFAAASATETTVAPDGRPVPETNIPARILALAPSIVIFVPLVISPACVISVAPSSSVASL